MEILIYAIELASSQSPNAQKMLKKSDVKIVCARLKKGNIKNMDEIQIDPEMNMEKDMDLLKDSKGVMWIFTTLEDIPRDLFKKYVKGKLFIDIGCGDGRVVSLAMRCGAKRYHGIEMEEKFFKKSPFQRHIKKGDYRNINPNNYEVVYYFLGSTESIPPDKKGEPEFIDFIKNFDGVLMVYHRKVSHRLEKFQENLFKEGFKEIDKSEYLEVYRK